MAISLGLLACAWVFLRYVRVPSPHLRKLFEMFLALVSIQTAGAYLSQTLGPTLGGGWLVKLIAASALAWIAFITLDALV